MGLSTVAAFKNLNLNDERYVHLEGDLLRKYQMALLNIAKDIIEVCDEEHISYHLGGGSALGAVRYHGFIPWDDDMDINIMGYQREIFIKKFKQKYGDKYWIHTYDTPEYGMDMSRIRLRGSVCRTREDITNDECGFYIDIFFLENVYNDTLRRNFHGIMCMSMGLLLSCRNFYKNRALMRSIEKDNPALRRSFEIKINIGRLLSFASVRSWTILTHKCYSLCKNSKSKYVSFPSGKKHYFKELYLRDGMENTIKMNFEGYQWCIPRDYDTYFRTLYGADYMIPPPDNMREKHVVLELKFPSGQCS